MNQNIKKLWELNFMAEEKCPTIGAMGVTSGTWVVTDSNLILCLETGVALKMEAWNEVIQIIPGDRASISLWNFKTPEECIKKFEWLKSILIGAL